MLTNIRYRESLKRTQIVAKPFNLVVGWNADYLTLFLLKDRLIFRKTFVYEIRITKKRGSIITSKPQFALNFNLSI